MELDPLSYTEVRAAVSVAFPASHSLMMLVLYGAFLFQGESGLASLG
jgi:hypothetical protein